MAGGGGVAKADEPQPHPSKDQLPGISFCITSPPPWRKKQGVMRKETRGGGGTCMCSPTTHPGSFRCNLHKSFVSRSMAPYSPKRLNARRSAMMNSIVRIGGVEGDLVKRALSALIWFLQQARGTNKA